MANTTSFNYKMNKTPATHMLTRVLFWGLFLESPDTYQSLVLLPLFTFKISVYNMIKLSVFTNRNWLVCWVGLTLSFFRF